jgi:hypothetical protein
MLIAYLPMKGMPMSYMKRLLEDIMFDVHVDGCTCQVCDPEFNLEILEELNA